MITVMSLVTSINAKHHNSVILPFPALALICVSFERRIIAAYRAFEGSWGLYFAVWLAPDLAMLGYIWGSRVGALCYNTTHALIRPFALTALGVITADMLLTQLGLVSISHVGIDRVLGYGLNYRDGFHHTHFTRT